jgi:hypothetical protein
MGIEKTSSMWLTDIVAKGAAMSEQLKCGSPCPSPTDCPVVSRNWIVTNVGHFPRLAGREGPSLQT